MLRRVLELNERERKIKEAEQCVNAQSVSFLLSYLCSPDLVFQRIHQLWVKTVVKHHQVQTSV